MFNILAVENRVNTFDLPDDRPICTLDNLQLSDLLPNNEDNMILRKNWCTLTAHIIVKYLPKLSFIASHVPKEIEHKHMAEVAKKTTIVSIYL